MVTDGGLSGTRSALANHAGAAHFAYNCGLGLVGDHLHARRVRVVLACARRAAGTARGLGRRSLGPLCLDRRRSGSAERGHEDVAPWRAKSSTECSSKVETHPLGPRWMIYGDGAWSCGRDAPAGASHLA